MGGSRRSIFYRFNEIGRKATFDGKDEPAKVPRRSLQTV
jgi:hypothetical protein